jgi:hypothetical protein
MQVIRLEAENFKRLRAVEITPEGNVVQIGGKNGSGKSSVLDAIYVALVGRSAAPPKPIRDGEEQCTIKLDLGELRITRSFRQKEGGNYTDSLKVENADGLRYATKPQEVLDALLGEIGFDPFEFVQMKPAQQADTLLGMVPLPVDLDDLAAQDESDFANRRDINRDAAALKAQIDAIPKADVPADLPDRAALQDQLAQAADTNAKIAQDRIAREATERNLAGMRQREGELREQAARMIAEADSLVTAGDAMRAELEALPPLAEPVDADAIREKLRTADATLAEADRQKRRRELETQLESKTAESERLTKAMDDRERERQTALAKAKMPIDGLAFAIDERGKPVVQFGGVPFEQASTAEQLRASTAIAMAANPSLRVLRVKDGALLDEDSMRLLAEMAKEQDFQLWVEVVGTGASVGVIMEDGQIAGGADQKPKAKAAKSDKPEGTLV